MLILMYFFMTNAVLPVISACAETLLSSTMIIVIILGGLILLLGLFGIKVSNNLDLTILGGIFSAISYIIRSCVNAIGWIVKNVATLLPYVYTESKKFFLRVGVYPTASKFFAFFYTVLLLVLII